MPINKRLETRSPIKERPLRDAGQGLHEQIEELRDEEFIPWLIISIFVALSAASEWLRWWLNLPYTPIIATLMAMALFVLTYRQYRTVKNQIANLQLGLDGERSVGQRLQADLIPLGYRIFHDICFDNFNIDHVAIGPAGVLIIEVKTRSKEVGRDKQVTYDGSRILIGKRELEPNPLNQVQACTKALHKLLYNRTGKSALVRGVIVFPGWWVSESNNRENIWVLNDTRVRDTVTKQPAVFDLGQTHVFAEALSRAIRERLDQEDARP